MIVAAAILFHAGFLVCAAGNIWLLVSAFRQDIKWGLALLIPIVSVVAFVLFCVHHFDKAWKPLLAAIVGGAFWGIGYAMGGDIFDPFKEPVGFSFRAVTWVLADVWGR